MMNGHQNSRPPHRCARPLGSKTIGSGDRHGTIIARAGYRTAESPGPQPGSRSRRQTVCGQVISFGRSKVACFAILATLPFVRPALAQNDEGFYVSLGGGYDILQTQHARSTANADAPAHTAYRFDTGFVGLGALGYQLDNGLRFEIEGGYRASNVNNHVDTLTPGATTGHQQAISAMANVIYDVDLEKLGIAHFPVAPYIGIGAGYAWTQLSPFTESYGNGDVERVGGTQGGFAFQGIVGVSYDIDAVPGLAATVEYRLFSTLVDDSSFRDAHFGPGGASVGRARFDESFYHDILVGLRYSFGKSPAPPPPPAAPVAAPQPTPARTYLVFFDWDRADLTDRARQIIAEAAQASTRVQTTRIEANGYTDRSGTPAYNQRLSIRRGQAVAGELVRDGVRPEEISVQGFGESHPLVPTADGVREPQNRRVEIVLR